MMLELAGLMVARSGATCNEHHMQLNLIAWPLNESLCGVDHAQVLLCETKTVW